MRPAPASAGWAALQRTHRKRVPQIVQARATSRPRLDACLADQPVEGLLDGNVAKRSRPRLSMNTGSSSEPGPRRSRYRCKPATAVSCSGTSRVLRNLVSRISRPSLVTSAIVSFRVSEIRNPVAESSAIKVA